MEMEQVEMGKTKEEDVYQRKGTVWTATAHCITAVIGSGILALSWSVGQMGWVLGPITLLTFAAITYYASTLLADCYRSPHPITGSRNPTYMDAVKSYLGPKNVLLCAIIQYANLWGAMISYTITASISMMSVTRSNCYHRHGQNAKCTTTGNLFMVMFGATEILLSQLPSMDKIAWLSVVAATMSFAYSIISLYLCFAKWITNHGEIQGTPFGSMADESDGVSSAVKIWNAFQGLGNIAFAYTFAEVMLEIQDTLKASPSENVVMKKANLYGLGTTTIFYLSIGCVGYAAFGNSAPGNILTGFYEPFWLVDLAHICIVIHLVGAYQVFAQPIFACFERKIVAQWPNVTFIHNVYTVRVPLTNGSSLLSFNISKLLLRSIFIVFSTLVAMLLPFFNAIMGLLGASSFWALTVHAPVSMTIVQKNIEKGTPKWIMLQGLSLFCFLISLASAVGSVAGIVDSLKGAKPFHIVY